MDVAEHEGTVRTADGRTIGWMTRGIRDGEVVAWLHGQPGSRRDIRYFDEQTLSRFGINLFSIDRAGYGATDPAGLDRRDVARDLFTVADHLGITRFRVMAVSMGGVYALTAAALEPDRITRILLISGHVMPYDDPAVIDDLSPSEQADIAALRGGLTPELDAEYEATAQRVSRDALGLLTDLARDWSGPERDFVATPAAAAVAQSVVFGLSQGHVGMLEDGLRTVRPLEVDLRNVHCPVRAIHGIADDLEPYANLERAAALVPDATIVALPGMGHFGPLLWPDVLLGLLTDA